MAATPASPVSKPRAPAVPIPVSAACAQGDDRRHERHSRHEKARERVRERCCSAEPEQDPRHSDLDDRKGHDPAPLREHGPVVRPQRGRAEAGSTAAIEVLAKTSVAGEISSTAIRMNRYGIPRSATSDRRGPALFGVT